MESTKRRRYHMLSITPGVLEHLGHMGQGMCAIVKAAHRDADPYKRSRTIDSAYQTLAATVQRANVTLLAAAGELKN